MGMRVWLKAIENGLEWECVDRGEEDAIVTTEETLCDKIDESNAEV
jgi:hypothetical protein